MKITKTVLLIIQEPHGDPLNEVQRCMEPGPLREKKCAGARCFLGPLSDILLWFSCFVVCYRLRLKKPAMCIKIFDEHLSIVAVQKCATESEFMTMLKSYIE